MPTDTVEFETKCTKVQIDYTRCEPAKSGNRDPMCGFACVKADRMYDRNVLRIKSNRPVLALPAEDVQKVSNESLSWEYACNMTGNYAIKIVIAFPGLEEYREKMHFEGKE